MHNHPIRIMLVDGHPAMLWGLEKLIEREKPKMEVVGKAGSSAQAMRLLETVSPDLILMDIDLNGESGITAIPDLIARSKARVLVLTGSRDPSLHDSAVLAGAVGVVQKADTTETILKAIEKTYHGEIWLDRTATSRIFLELSRKKTAQVNDPEQRKILRLTPRERQIVAEIGNDAAATSKMIAERFHISEHTLRNHLASVYEKLGLSSRLELFAYASKYNIKVGVIHGAQ